MSIAPDGTGRGTRQVGEVCMRSNLHDPDLIDRVCEFKPRE